MIVNLINLFATRHRLKGFLLFLIGFCALTNFAIAEEARKWVSQDGRSIVAVLEEVKGDYITLLKGGKSYRLATETLNPEGRAYIKKWDIEKRESRSSAPNGTALKISKRGRLLYKTDFKNNDGWRVSSGQWQCKDNEVTASQTGKGHKGHMVIKKPKPVNVIIECEILLLEGGSVGFTIDDAPNKLGLVNFSTKGFGAQALHRVKKPPIKKRFNGIKIPLKKDEWHHVTIEMIGNEVSISSNGHESACIDDIWAGKPKRLGFRVAGGPSKYRNLKMWEALPQH